MNPAIVWRLAAAVGGLLGVAGTAFGVDQHAKRKQEQSSNRARLREIEEGLSAKEDELASLRSTLGEKNDQVRILAAEIEMLREQASALRGSE